MKRRVVGWLALALTSLVMAGAADVANREGDLKHEAATVDYPAKMEATNSAEDTRPQLAATTNTAPDVPMAPETPQPVIRSGSRLAEAAPGAAERRKTGRMILAVLAVVAGSYLLQRWRSRSDPP